ncbi:hypothetical protein FGIG_00635 [Fasciola gigantica]|uniref:Uncharacterized protein n=1 Tax=Fasciola gigantica TaxID=46835 RepID=A0A504YB44_FASGI|nr:hypothetical protein FGIG_00635 [Fasciola gigantica]
MMITPPKHSYNLNLGCFSTVNSSLFPSIDRTVSAITDPTPVSHCTRPSSVPSSMVSNGHRDTIGFMSTRIASPLSEDPLHSPTLDYSEDPLSSTTTHSLATPPASCGQQTVSTLTSGNGMQQGLDTSILQSRLSCSPSSSISSTANVLFSSATTCYSSSSSSSASSPPLPQSLSLSNSMPSSCVTASSPLPVTCTGRNSILTTCVAGSIPHEIESTGTNLRPIVIDPDILESELIDKSNGRPSGQMLRNENRTQWPPPPPSGRGLAQKYGPVGLGSSAPIPTSTTVSVHFPSLMDCSDGTSTYLRLPPDVVVKPERFLNNGDRVDPFRNRLKDVVITLIDSTGRVLYHKCHFSGSRIRLSKSFQPDGTCWRDHVNTLDQRLWEDHFTGVLNQATRWNDPNCPFINDTQTEEDLVEHSGGNTTTGATHSCRVLLDGPVYRANLDSRWFFVHTFSLRVHCVEPGESVRTDQTLDQSSSVVRLTITDCVLQKPLTIHYHSLLEECESERDVISSSSRRPHYATTIVAWSSARNTLPSGPNNNGGGGTAHLDCSPTAPVLSSSSSAPSLVNASSPDLILSMRPDSITQPPIAMCPLSSPSSSSVVASVPLLAYSTSTCISSSSSCPIPITWSCSTTTTTTTVGQSGLASSHQSARVLPSVQSSDSSPTVTRSFRSSPVLNSNATSTACSLSAALVCCSPENTQIAGVSKNVRMQWENSASGTLCSLPLQVGQEHYTAIQQRHQHRHPPQTQQEPHHHHHHHHHHVYHHHPHPTNGPNGTTHHHHHVQMQQQQQEPQRQKKTQQFAPLVPHHHHHYHQDTANASQTNATAVCNTSGRTTDLMNGTSLFDVISGQTPGMQADRLKTSRAGPSSLSPSYANGPSEGTRPSSISLSTGLSQGSRITSPAVAATPAVMMLVDVSTDAQNVSHAAEMRDCVSCTPISAHSIHPTVVNATTDHHSSICEQAEQSTVHRPTAPLNWKSARSGKDQYGERIMRLQNLLPPEAIQRIRQIWHEIYGPSKSLSSSNVAGSGSVSIAPSVVTTTATSTSSFLSASTVGTGPTTVSTTSVSNTATLREHFARRVRQVVRQYLGPNALVNLNRASIIVPPNTSHGSSPVANRAAESYTIVGNSTQTVTAPIFSCSTPVVQLSQVVSPQGTPSSARTLNGLSTLSTEQMTVVLPNSVHPGPLTDTVTANMNANASSIAFVPATTICTVSQAFTTGLHATASGLRVVVSESIKPQESKASMNELVSVGSSCIFATTIATTPEPTISGAGSSSGNNSTIINSPGIVGLTTSGSTTLPVLSMLSPQPAPVLEPQPPASRRTSNTSQCCVLEWLLSDEADLCLLPPSFYETKTSLSSSSTNSTTTNVTEPVVSTIANVNPFVESTLFTDRIMRGPSLTACSGALTIQLPTSVPGTGAILVSPVTPIATTPVRATVEQPGTPTDRSIIPTVDQSDHSGPELAVMTGSRPSLSVCSSSFSSYSSLTCPVVVSSSSGTSPIISSSPIQTHRPGSLLVVCLHTTTLFTTLGTMRGRGQLHKTNIGSEPTSPEVSFTRMDPGNKRLSDHSMSTASLASLSSSSSSSIPVYQTQILSGPRSLDISPINNSSVSSSTCHASPLSSAVFNPSDSRGCSTVFSTASGRSKRRRSGPPTPFLNMAVSSNRCGSVCELPGTSSNVAVTTSTNVTRMRHVSYVDGNHRHHHPRVTSTDDRPEGLASPPFTSLTQLLLQDFPATTATILNGTDYTATENSPSPTLTTTAAPASSHSRSEIYNGLVGSSAREGHSVSSSSLFTISPTKLTSTSISFHSEYGKSTATAAFLTDAHSGLSESNTMKFSAMASVDPETQKTENALESLPGSGLITNPTANRANTALSSSYSLSGLSTSDRLTTANYTVPATHSPAESVGLPTSISPSIKSVSYDPGHQHHTHHPTNSVSGAQSSLCRLLLDPQLGPPEPIVTTSNSLNIRSPRTPLATTTPVSPGLVSAGRARRLSSSVGTKKVPPKSTGLDVYEFSISTNGTDVSVLKPVESPTSGRFHFTTNSGGMLSSTKTTPFPRSSFEPTVPVPNGPSSPNSYSSRLITRDEQDTASSKVIAEEVEFLYEILRRDELERSQEQHRRSSTSTEFDGCSPRTKRSRLSTPYGSVDHDDEDGITNESRDAEWQTNDAQAVARICEQLQEGFASVKSAEDATMTPLNPELLLTEPILTSKPIQIGVNREYNLDMLPRPATLMDGEIECVIHHLSSSPSSSSRSLPSVANSGSSRGSLNEAAVAAARASQQAAASQRNKAANQRLLVEQRKRLIQHQLYNQFTVYSASPNRPHQVNNQIFISDVKGPSAGALQSPPAQLPRNARQVSGSSPSESQIQSRTRHASSSLLYAVPSGSTQTNVNANGCPSLIVHGLHLTATTVMSISSTSPGPALSSRSNMSKFYRHRPEDLPRYLKEVGPNVRVQLSAPPAVVLNSNRLSETKTHQPVTGEPLGFSSDVYNFVQSSPTSDMSTSSIAVLDCARASGHMSDEQSSPPLGNPASQDMTCSITTPDRSVLNVAESGSTVLLTSAPSMTPSMGFVNDTTSGNFPSLVHDSTSPYTTNAVDIQSGIEVSKTGLRQSSKSGNTSARAASNNTRNRRIVSASPASAGGTTADSLRSPSGFPSSLLPSSKALSTNGVCFADSSAQWTSAPCTSTMTVSPRMTNPAYPRATSISESYILGYVPNPINVVTSDIVSPDGPETQAYAFNTQPPLTSQNMLLMHSEQAALESQSTVAVVCDPVTAVSLNPAQLSQQSSAFVYAISPLMSAAPHAQEPGTRIAESSSITQPTATTQLFVVSPMHSPSRAFNGLPSNYVDAIDASILTSSTSPVTPLSRFVPATNVQSFQSAPGTGEICFNSGSLKAGKPAAAAAAADAAPDILLVSNSDPLDTLFDSDSKPEESLLPDDIINAVFGLETMVAAKQHQNRQSSAMFADSADPTLCFSRYSPTVDGDSEMMMDLHGLPSTASSSPSPCSPQLNNPLPSDMRYSSSCLTP